MKRILALLLVAALPAWATDISPGLSIGTGAGQIQDGQRLTSAKLLQLVSDATIQTTFYTSKVSQTNLVGADTLLVVSAASGTFHKLTGNQALLQNYRLITDQSVYSTLAGYDSFLIYDPTNGVFGQVAFSNLVGSSAGFVVVSNLVLATTNGNTVATLGYLPDPTSTNNQMFSLVWDTNGIPRGLSYSNLLRGAGGYIGTNLEPKYVFAQMFTPGTFYYTNSLTNIWGFTNVAAITNLYFGTNTLLFTNNTTVQALTNTDTLPIRSVKQGNTNTTVTLEALQQWLLTNAPATTRYTATNASGLAAGVTTFAHGLGATPGLVRASLLCVTNDSAWRTNQELAVEGLYIGGSIPNYSVTADSSNITIRAYSASPSVVTNASATDVLTSLRWRIKVIAQP